MDFKLIIGFMLIGVMEALMYTPQSCDGKEECTLKTVCNEKSGFWAQVMSYRTDYGTATMQTSTYARCKACKGDKPGKGCGRFKTSCNRKDSGFGRYMRMYCCQTCNFKVDWRITGSVYIQHGNVPPSYHFISNDICYISYANAPSSWRLDDGNKFPQKKYFTRISINENERIFKGDINWHPTSLRGEVVWSYEIHFAEDYAITSGTVKAYDGINKKNLIKTYIFGVDLHYKRQRGNKRRDAEQEKVEVFPDDAGEKMTNDGEKIVEAGEKIIVDDMAELKVKLSDAGERVKKDAKPCCAGCRFKCH